MDEDDRIIINDPFLSSPQSPPNPLLVPNDVESDDEFEFPPPCSDCVDDDMAAFFPPPTADTQPAWDLPQCDDEFEFPPLPIDCVDDEFAISSPLPTPCTQPAWDLLQVSPPNNRADPCPSLASSFPIRACPFHTHAGPSHTQKTVELKTEAFTCRYCKKELSTKDILLRHLALMHSDWAGCPTSFECNHCGKHYAMRYSLLEHIRIKHSTSKQEHSCSQCGKTFGTVRSRNRHRKLFCPLFKKRPLPTGDEPAAVDTGEVGAKAQPAVEQPGPSTGTSGQPSNLGKGRELHVCPKCGRMYVAKRSLCRHLRYECGVSPQFSCTLCSFKASQNAILKRHMIRKHGLPYTH